mmetsp:Transcript_79/g.271  ORF Transcript_79/g.271 Transcript_79/m.271 type:complete len:358 (+) Transcript_79:76-1149(+)
MAHRGALGLSAILIFLHFLLWLAPDNLSGVVKLVPGQTLTRPWMILTSNVFEDSFPNLVLSLGAILGSSVLLIDRWGELEAGRYLVIVAALQASFSWVGMVTLYILFREHHFLFARLGGLTGLVGGLSVAVAQHVAANPSSVPPYLAAMLRCAPLGALAWSAVLLLLTHAGPPDELLFSLFGILSGWTYLRYYQPRPGDSLLRPAAPTGDSSDSFAFAALWPAPLQPPLQLAGAALFGVLSSCCCGLFPPSTAGCGLDEPIWGGGGGASAHGSAFAAAWFAPGTSDLEAPPPSVTTGDPLVAERRRQRARELLEQRMAAKVASAAPAPLTSPRAAAGATVGLHPPPTPAFTIPDAHL